MIGGALNEEEEEKVEKIVYGVKPAPGRGASRQTCCMQGCHSVYRGPGLFFFRFPMGEPLKLKRWINNMNKQPPGWTPSNEDWICMYHFKDVRLGKRKVIFSNSKSLFYSIF